jgi:Kdo2-lipid IVA lauroyltransferase/acyltransferase
MPALGRWLEYMASAPEKKKKKKQPRPVRDYLLYLVVRVVAIFLQMSDITEALRVARALGRGLYRVYGRGRQRALENLRHSYPEKSEAWIEQTARRSFEHLVMFAFDILYTARLMRPSTWSRHIEFSHDRVTDVLQLMLRRRGVIMVTGHYGNFEVLGCVFAALGLETYNIARPIDNPYINRYVYTVLHRGQTIIYKKGATESMHQVLSRGAALGIVADQNGSRKDLFVPFFGRKAATYKSIGLMAMEYNVPIVVGCARRQGDRYRFEMCLSRVIRPEEWQSQADPLHWITEQYTAAIEQFVRADPQQYWWVHRRWKTRPPEERAAVVKEKPPINADERR